MNIVTTSRKPAYILQIEYEQLEEKYNSNVCNRFKTIFEEHLTKKYEMKLSNREDDKIIIHWEKNEIYGKNMFHTTSRYAEEYVEFITKKLIEKYLEKTKETTGLAIKVSHCVVKKLF